MMAAFLGIHPVAFAGGSFPLTRLRTSPHTARRAVIALVSYCDWRFGPLTARARLIISLSQVMQMAQFGEGFSRTETTFRATRSCGHITVENWARCGPL